MGYSKALRNVKEIVDTYRVKGEYDEVQLLNIEITNLRMQLKRALGEKGFGIRLSDEGPPLKSEKQGEKYQITGDLRGFLRNPLAGPIHYDPAFAIKACDCGWNGKGSGGGAITQGDRCPDCGAQLL